MKSKISPRLEREMQKSIENIQKTLKGGIDMPRRDRDLDEEDFDDEDESDDELDSDEEENLREKKNKAAPVTAPATEPTPQNKITQQEIIDAVEGHLSRVSYLIGLMKTASP